MTIPETNGPDQPTGRLSVSTAPPSAPRRWLSAVPHHLGRARTSTVVLALLFVGLYTLYLYVRPPDEAVRTVPAPASTVQTPAVPIPVEPTGTTEPTTTAPTTTPPPTSSPTLTPPGETPGEFPGPTPTTTAEPTATEAPLPPEPTTTGSSTP